RITASSANPTAATICQSMFVVFIFSLAIGYSTRSVVVLVRFPEATTIPSRLIEYGYVGETVTGSPASQSAVTVTDNLLVSRPLDDCTRAVVCPTGFGD